MTVFALFSNVFQRFPNANLNALASACKGLRTISKIGYVRSQRIWTTCRQNGQAILGIFVWAHLWGEIDLEHTLVKIPINRQA